MFSVLKHYQANIILSGNICLDEAFFTCSKKDLITRPDGKGLRGISRNKICIACGKDDSGRILLICENTSKPSNSSTWKALGSHIRQKSHLIHDGEHSHSVLIDGLSLTSEVHDTKKTSNLRDKDNPLDQINEIHSLAKRFMKAHGGYNRQNLQDFMNLISFILNEPSDRCERTLYLRMRKHHRSRFQQCDQLSPRGQKITFSIGLGQPETQACGAYVRLMNNKQKAMKQEARSFMAE